MKNEKIHYIISLGKELEEKFLEQYAYIIVHQDSKEKNTYRIRKEKMEKLMLNKELSEEGRIKTANHIISMADEYKVNLVEKLETINSQIQGLIINIELDFDEVKNEGDFQDILNDFKEWIEYSKSICIARSLATRSIAEQVEMDKRLPNIIIKNEGDEEKKFSKEETQTFTSGVLDYAMLMMQASSMEEKTSKRKEYLANELFG